MNIFSPRCLASEASCTDVFKKPAPSTWSSVQMFAPPPRKKSGTYLKCAICKCWHMDITRTHHHPQDSRHAHLSHPSSGQPAICLPSPCISLRFLEFYMEKAMAPHSSTLAWKIPWTEEPGGLQSMGSLRVGHDWEIHFHFSLSCIGEGNGNPLQCSCLENPRDGGAWWAAVYGVAQSWTWLKWLSSSSSSSSVLYSKTHIV